MLAGPRREHRSLRPRRRSRAGRAANPSVRILVGLVAGVAVGLFFGEDAALLQPLADLYIRAMQMTVLPYLVLTLIGGLGKLDLATARRLGLRALLLLLALLLLAAAVIAVMPLAFPSLVSASFYSDTLIEPGTASHWASCTCRPTRSTRWPTRSCRGWCCSARRSAWR